MNAKIGSTLSRRHLLALSMGLGGAMTLQLAGCGATDSAAQCADPEKLSDDQLSLRTSLHYVERAAGAQSCSGCAFFKSGAQAACGTCELLKGPANPRGRCDSW